MTVPQASLDDDSLALVHYSLSRQGDRTYNEDAYCHVRDEGVISFAVADGMGGAAGGLHAANQAMLCVREQSLVLNPDTLIRQFEAISDSIKREQKAHPDTGNMCTTLAELRLDTYAQTAVWAHWGDTRIYWFRGSELMSMTEDHSVVQSLVSAGLISEEEAVTYPKRNVLLGAAGANSEVGPTVLETPVAVTNGDAFLLCTDGVWSQLKTSFIEEALSRSFNVQDWINILMDEVARVGTGSNDNFTATGVWITADSDKTIFPGL